MDKFLQTTLKQLENFADNEETLLKKEELKKALLKVKPFTKRELTPELTKKRIEKAANDFWYFDKKYFPSSMYEDYAAPGKFHKDLSTFADLKDKKAHLVIGPRDHAKTAVLKKKFIWQFLFGKRKFMAVGSETLDTPKSYLLDVIYFLTFNERIINDFNLTWHEKSTEKLFATSEVNPSGTFATVLSEEKSSRGKQRMFDRLDFILLTDFENLTSSLTKEAVEKRFDRLNEMRGSLSKSGTLLWEANNFSTECLANHLLDEKDKGIISENVIVHLYSAWDDKRPFTQRSLWASRFPAKSEKELKEMCKPKDEYDWLANFQGRPIQKSGDIFPNNYYAEWDKLPNDVQSVIWTDPNTSEKGKGDTTAIAALGFSSSTQKFYLTGARCKSYFHSNELLTDIIALQVQEQLKKIHIITLGMDGNVTQESNWKNNIHNYVQIKKVPYPTVLFRKWNVDSLATNLESVYKEGRLLFPPEFAKTEEGKEFLKQFFGFRLKKAGKKDDAPDAMICAYTLLIELGIAYILNDEPLILTLSHRKIKRI